MPMSSCRPCCRKCVWREERRMSELKKIAVLVSVAGHPVSGTPRYSRNDAAALSLAQQLVQQVSRHAADVVVDVIHAGNPDDPALRDYLALGAHTIHVLALSGTADPAVALRQRLASYDLVLCGQCAEDGEQSGLLPYLLAAQLQRPLVSAVIALEHRDASLQARQFLPKGKRRIIGLQLPAFAVVHPQAP